MRVLLVMLGMVTGGCNMTQEEADQMARAINQASQNFNNNYQQNRPKTCYSQRIGNQIQTTCY